MSTPPFSADDRLAAIRQRVRRLAWWSGVCASLTAVFGGLILAGGLDWVLRLEDVGVRALLAVTVWTVVGVTLWRTLWRPLRFPLTDAWLADQVDRRYPGLSGRSRTAAEFASSACDPQWGSTELQALVIRQSQADLAQVAPEDVASPGHVGPRLWSAWGTCVLAAALLLAYPLEAATAMRRLLWPWGHQPWPQTTLLALFDAAGQPLTHDPDDPFRAVRGETLSFQVRSARGPLPREVWLETRADGQATPEISLLKQDFRERENAPSEQVGTIELPIARGDVEFRAVGGDDRSMPWYRVRMIEPPTIADFEITVTPPAYSGLPTQTLPAGATQIRGLIGSQVVIAVRATKPLGRVELMQRELTATPLPVWADGHSFRGELTISKPGTAVFWFALSDRQGFREQQPLEFELNGEIDAVPEVVLQQPDGDRLVTPTATVPLQLSSRDDRGLTHLQLVWQVDESEPTVRELDHWDDRPLQSTYSADWLLGELGLRPGQRLVFRGEALDACDVGEPHVGRTPPRTLLIVSPDEKSADIARRAGELLDDLSDAARLQERLGQQTEALETQLETVGELRSEDRDQLQRLQFDQRRLHAQLVDPQHGLSRRARQLQSEFPENGLSQADSGMQLADLAATLEELSTSALPHVDQQLTQAAKLLDQPDAERTVARTALAAARQGQAEIQNALTERQNDLAQWQSEQELTGELQALLENQRQVNADTADLGAQTISRAPAELSPQQNAELQKLASRQRQQADRIGQFERRLEQLSQKLAQDEPTRAGEASEAAQKLNQQQLDAGLRQAADDIAANRMGAAGQQQQQALQALTELQEAWAEELPDDAERLAQRLSQLENQARDLAERAEELRKHSDEESLTADDREQLRKQSEELRREAQRIERQLNRMRQLAAADAAHRASQELRQAEAAAGEADDPEQLRKRTAAAEEALQDVAKELQQSRQQVAARLMQEERERIAARIEMLKARQQSVLLETVRLDDQRQDSGRFTRGQQRSLQDLAGVERELTALASELRDQLATAVVAKAALSGVVRSLERAADRLTERETGLVTQQLEQDAIARLTRILAAWNRTPEPPAGSETDTPTDDNDEPQQASPPGEAIPLTVQLALLRELQAGCLDRTVALEQQRKPDGTLPADVAPLATDLAAEQAELLSLAQQLIEQLTRSTPPADSVPEAQF